jgi:hypothetical protein
MLFDYQSCLPKTTSDEKGFALKPSPQPSPKGTNILDSSLAESTDGMGSPTENEASAPIQDSHEG